MSTLEIIVPILAAIGGAIVGGFAAYCNERSKEERAKATRKKDAELERERMKEAEKKALQAERKAFYWAMKGYLDGAKFAGENHFKIRNMLYASLDARFADLPPRNQETLYEEYHHQMNDDELRLFNLIRGLTRKTYENNSKMAELLAENPQVYSEISEFSRLRDHLDFWLAKYSSSSFETNEDMCLVYLGVQERVPFPGIIRELVDQKIEEITGEIADH